MAGTGILTDFSRERLAAAVEENQIEWIVAQGRFPGMEFHQDLDAIWVRASQSGRPKHVCALRLDSVTAREHLEAILTV